MHIDKVFKTSRLFRCTINECGFVDIFIIILLNPSPGERPWWKICVFLTLLHPILEAGDKKQGSPFHSGFICPSRVDRFTGPLGQGLTPIWIPGTKQSVWCRINSQKIFVACWMHVTRSIFLGNTIKQSFKRRKLKILVLKHWLLSLLMSTKYRLHLSSPGLNAKTMSSFTRAFQNPCCLNDTWL